MVRLELGDSDNVRHIVPFVESLDLLAQVHLRLPVVQREKGLPFLERGILSGVQPTVHDSPATTPEQLGGMVFVLTQIRIYLERFTAEGDTQGEHSIGYKLFTYSGGRAFSPTNSLRASTHHKREIFSDVFIFEKSDRSEFYNLVVMKNNGQKPFDSQSKEVFFTIGVG